jgi:hypothetical protein
MVSSGAGGPGVILAQMMVVGIIEEIKISGWLYNLFFIMIVIFRYYVIAGLRDFVIT